MDAADSFHFAYRLQAGDFDVRVQLQTMEGAASMGGLMVRESLDPRSAYLGLFVTRTETGQVWKVLGRGAVPLGGPWPALTDLTNAWLRLARKGSNRYFVYASSNSVDWIPLFPSPIESGLPGNLPFLGIATAAGNSSSEAVAEYRDFGDIVPLPIPALTIARESNDVTIAWFTFDPNYLLEASAEAAAASWVPLVRSAEWNNEAMFPAQGRAVFFRLRKNEQP